ncbi:hypothetical protein DSECCO2_579310 [anaerobic digester metagenome]
MKKSKEIAAFFPFALLAVLLPIMLAAPSFHDKCEGDPKLKKKIDYCFHVFRLEDGGESVSDIVRCIRYMELASGIPPVMGDEYAVEYVWNDDASCYRDIAKWQEWYRQKMCSLSSDYCDSIVILKLKAVEDSEYANVKPDAHYQFLEDYFINDTVMSEYLKYIHENHSASDVAYSWYFTKYDKTDSLVEMIYPNLEKSRFYFADYLSANEFRNIFNCCPYNHIFGYPRGDVYFVHEQNFSAIMLTDDYPYGLLEYCFIYTKTPLKNPSLLLVKKDWYAFKRYNINFHLY